MSGSMLRRGLLAICLLAGFAAGAMAQTAKLQGFASPDAAAAALTDALRKDDDKAVAAILGAGWREFVPGTREDEDHARAKYLAAWDEGHKVTVAGATAVVEVGKTGFTNPIPLIKDGEEWRYDIEAGRREIDARTIGHNELTVVQTLLAIVDAQRDYTVLDPMKTGTPTYARRLLSTPGKKDGLYWESKPGEPASPLGPSVANAQLGSAPTNVYSGYRVRLLYGQGPAAPGGAYDYLVKDRMIGGFAVVAWPERYGETGVMTFIVSHSGQVYERDLGPETAQRAAGIVVFNPDKDWEKADMTP